MVRTIVILFLIIVFLISCITLIVGGSSALWLHTYKVFTERTPVAQVQISPLKSDEGGEYADVTISMVKEDSALAYLLGQSKGISLENGSAAFDNAHNFKIYGDTIYVGGPIIKFRDALILINFKTIYKLGKVYGRYDLDNVKEQNKSEQAQMQSSYDLNGGYADWKSIFDSINADNLSGKFYDIFIDTSQISAAGIFVGDRERNYIVYMTVNGFIWDEQR